MGEHTSGGAALAQHGMSERASEGASADRHRPLRPERARALAKRGLDSAWRRLPLRAAVRSAAGCGRAERSPVAASDRVPLMCVSSGPRRGGSRRPNSRGGCLEEKGPGGPRRVGASRSQGCRRRRSLAGPLRRDRGDGTPANAVPPRPGVLEQAELPNFRAPQVAPQPHMSWSEGASLCSEGRETFAISRENNLVFSFQFGPPPPPPPKIYNRLQTKYKI
ncbi:uncharacterized protein LOC134175213 [Pezoporus occidentalis]|uniref:uncharacterized protein LOC134175213 n=1 Tax=Pezoporus occidentalis TaxID=407982 RepID=UPI002F90B724